MYGAQKPKAYSIQNWNIKNFRHQSQKRCIVLKWSNVIS